MKVHVKFKGGPGSGNFGHSGRPGKVGGSAPRGILSGDIVLIDDNTIVRGFSSTWTGEIKGTRVHIKEIPFLPPKDYDDASAGLVDGPEVAAYKLSQILGYDNVPPTANKEFNGKNVTVQEWVEGGVTFKDYVGSGGNVGDIDIDSVKRVSILDMIMDNTDRHTRNHMVVNGKIVAIDNDSWGGSTDPREALYSAFGIHSAFFNQGINYQLTAKDLQPVVDFRNNRQKYDSFRSDTFTKGSVALDNFDERVSNIIAMYEELR